MTDQLERLKTAFADRYTIERELRCVAAPMFDKGQWVVAAISVLGADSNATVVDVDKTGALVRDACAEISQSLA